MSWDMRRTLKRPKNEMQITKLRCAGDSRSMRAMPDPESPKPSQEPYLLDSYQGWTAIMMVGREKTPVLDHLFLRHRSWRHTENDPDFIIRPGHQKVMESHGRKSGYL